MNNPIDNKRFKWATLSDSPQFRSRGRKSFQKAHDVAAGPRPYLFALMSSVSSALNV